MEWRVTEVQWKTPCECGAVYYQPVKLSEPLAIRSQCSVCHRIMRVDVDFEYLEFIKRYASFQVKELV